MRARGTVRLEGEMKQSCVYCHPSRIRPVVEGRTACEECAVLLDEWIDDVIERSREADA